MKTQQFAGVNTDAVEAHKIASLCMAIFDPPLSLQNSASAQREKEREPNKSVVACSRVFMAALYMCVYIYVYMLYVCLFYIVFNTSMRSRLRCALAKVREAL